MFVFGGLDERGRIHPKTAAHIDEASLLKGVALEAGDVVARMAIAVRIRARVYVFTHEATVGQVQAPRASDERTISVASPG